MNYLPYQYENKTMTFNEQLMALLCASDSEEDDEKESCLITGEPLLPNFVSLKCGHKFNYAPLFKELKQQKHNSTHSSLETTHLGIYDIKCPYCRTVQHGVIRYDDCMGPGVIGINWPPQKVYKGNKCKSIIKSGKRKGQPCSRACAEKYCAIHLKKITKKATTASVAASATTTSVATKNTIAQNAKIESNNNGQVDMVTGTNTKSTQEHKSEPEHSVVPEHETKLGTETSTTVQTPIISNPILTNNYVTSSNTKQNTIKLPKCTIVLKYGKRKGQMCGAKCASQINGNVNNEKICRRHLRFKKVT